MPRSYFLPIILLAAFFSFWKLGSGDVNEWDESLYGQNAIEMMHNGDYIHYYYAGEPDTWNAKPPLSVWLIIIAYKLFGFNAFALRFFSALATVFFFIYAYKLIRLYAVPKQAFIACSILLTTKAIIGFHVGRTGDTDALLAFFLTAFLYYFLSWLYNQKKYSIYYAAIFLGLAFYTKGFAAFILLPGLALYLVATRSFREVISSAGFRAACITVASIAASWIIILLINPIRFSSHAMYGSHSTLETMFFHDTINRLTNPAFDTVYKPDRTIFIRYLDVRFNIWNYFFYYSLIAMLFTPLLRVTIKGQLTILCLSMIAPVAVLLTFSVSTHDWYFTPIALFISTLSAQAISKFTARFKWLNAIWITVFVFTAYRQFTILNTIKTDSIVFFENNKTVFEKASTITVIDQPPHDYFLYLNWYAKSVQIKNKDTAQINGLLFFDKTKVPPKNIAWSDCHHNYCLAVSK
jgi:4-amino-4-deoxy-L-arabinose transferase-like glycosyltransferase